MTTTLAILTGVASAALGALLLGRGIGRPARPPRPAPDPVRRELAELREDHAAGELSTRDYQFLRERLAARMALRNSGPGQSGDRASGRWRWPLAGLVAAAVIVATLVPAVRQRSAGSFGTGNDQSAPQTIDPGASAWRGAERATASGDLRRAVARYRVAVAFLPDQPELRARFGFALAQSGRLAEARRQLEMSVRGQPRLADARLYLGAVLLRAGQPRAARRQWRTFLKLAPRGRDAGLVRRTLRRLGGPR